jgi:hypothetical protein
MSRRACSINALPPRSIGDFSKSLNTQGALRTIYDPYTTQTMARLSLHTLCGNVIPRTVSIRPRGDHGRSLAQLSGNGPTGVNNFLSGYANRFQVLESFGPRGLNANDKWKLLGVTISSDLHAVGRFHRRIACPTG